MTRLVLLGTDAVMLLISTNLAIYARFGRFRHASFSESAITGISLQFMDLALFFGVLTIAVLGWGRLYDPDRVFHGSGEFSRVGSAVTASASIFVVAMWAAHVGSVSRLWVALAWAFAIPAVVIGRLCVRMGLTYLHRKGVLMRPTVVLGENDEAVRLITKLSKNTTSALKPVGYLSSSIIKHGTPNGCDELLPCLGMTRDVTDIVRGRKIDTIVVASTAFEPAALAGIVTSLRGLDVDVEISAGLFDVTTSRVMVREVSGTPLIMIRGIDVGPGRQFVKRVIDVLVSATVLTVGLPLWIAVIAAIRFDSEGPIFYRQKRMGRTGTEFEMLKFRSMVVAAHEMRGDLAGANEASGPIFKIRDDPRVTRVGKWLRKFSIDEFPQLVNVLFGQMSLVGPRPPLPEEVLEYHNRHWRRLDVLPGITGLWQVSGRSNLTFDEMIQLDLYYIENWSVGLDLSILVRTIPAVLSTRGSY